MKRLSKKQLMRHNIELYEDNCRLQSEVDLLIAANTELAILNEQANRRIDEVNKKIEAMKND